MTPILSCYWVGPDPSFSGFRSRLGGIESCIWAAFVFRWHAGHFGMKILRLGAFEFRSLGFRSVQNRKVFLSGVPTTPSYSGDRRLCAFDEVLCGDRQKHCQQDDELVEPWNFEVV